jgi:hypothetical protein
LIAGYTFIFMPLTRIEAQEASFDMDIFAPRIQHSPASQPSAARSPMKIEATITDDVAVKKAILFYRHKCPGEYVGTQMETKGNDIYFAIIPKEAVSEMGIEYYIEASDEATNIVRQGDSSSPLVVAVLPVPIKIPTLSRSSRLIQPPGR